MKTQDEILARYHSDESEDFFGAQKLGLLVLLPYEVAKPFLDPVYIEAYENDTLPADERWKEIPDLNAEIMELIPVLYKTIESRNAVDAVEGIFFLKSWVWVVDEEFCNEITSLMQGPVEDMGKGVLDKIAQHFNYKPTIEDVDFEEVPKEESKEK